jgi:hypothetical protein
MRGTVCKIMQKVVLKTGVHSSSFISKLLTLYPMSKRVTIMIDDDLDKKLRQRQAKMIQQNQTSYSYSKTLNELLRKAL